jgi:hypothetical protein
MEVSINVGIPNGLLVMENPTKMDDLGCRSVSTEAALRHLNLAEKSA